ncbi:hypothetical protein [Nonomuraea sp. KM90]|uniref:hypothetical protein n=1 Tax=Nonomuraea sp. KM90 TaxID=3457428 RepID=UPI003FCEC4A6
MEVQLTGHIYVTIAPDEIVHRLDEKWSTFDYGPFRATVSIGDVTKVRAARELARVISAQAGFWESDLAAIEARLQHEEDAHTADPPAPVQDPTPAPEPTFAEQIAAPDPKLDAAVERVAALADAQRDPEEEGEL